MSRKKMITLFIVLLAIILVALVFLISFLKNRITNVEQLEEGSSILDEYGKAENDSISRTSYFDITTCVTEYLDMLNTQKSIYYQRDETGKFVLAVEENEIKEDIYSLLSQSYISKNNITIENLYNYVEPLEESVLFVPLEASVIQDADIARFLVHGLVETLELNVIDEIFVIVNIDVANTLFSIEPIEGDYNSISEIEVERTDEKIEANDNNEFIRYSVSYETTAKDYINLYKRLALGSPETMYNLLDEDYREARFGSVEEFEKYINENRENIFGIRVETYQATEKDGYTQYVCIDQYDNYYIFREIGILNYSVILDTYTIDLPEFIERYDSSANNIKVALNIEKLIEATKMGDYQYVYNKLNESFKANNFDTLEKLESYISERFDATEDEVEYVKYEEVAGVYTYNIEITDTSENEKIDAKIIMDLKDERDFAFSFSVEN